MGNRPLQRLMPHPTPPRVIPARQTQHQGLKCVLFLAHCRIDVSGVQTRFGSDAWLLGRQPSAASHAAVQPLVAAGARPEAVVPSEELGLG